MIALACPGCGQNLNLGAELAGKQASCPECGRLLDVPAPDVPGLQAITRPGRRADVEALCALLDPPQGPGEVRRFADYRVLGVLGVGGMGVVFRAEDTTIRRTVALKIMRPSRADRPTARQRFLREARLMAALQHERTIKLHQVGEHRGLPFLTMEVLEGETLEARLRRAPGLKLAEVLRIGCEVAEGLAAAHVMGVIHRDVKPANIWLCLGGRVKLLDFGLAREAEDRQQLTRPGAVVGTPGYLAPEQVSGKALDARCDLFALGCVLYLLCTGRTPFPGKDEAEALLALTRDHPVPPHEVNPRVPLALSELVLRLLAKHPDDRPPSAQAVVEALAAIEAGEPAQPVARRRWWRWLVAAALLVVIEAVVVFFVLDWLLGRAR